MTLSYLPVLLALVITSMPPVSAFAQTTSTTDSHVVHNREQVSDDADLDERLASDWGLDAAEWARYRQLMQGPLGVYSPHLDPLTALGIEARTDAERQRYAELQVQAEARRVGKLLAYQRAYDDAWKRLYPTLQPIAPAPFSQTPLAQTPLSQTNGGGTTATPGASDRLAVFVKEDCPACERRVRQLQAAGAAFDLYLIDSRQDDDRIRRWAAGVGIDPAKVRARTITLNHDAGLWRSIGLSGEWPAVVREVNGQWQRL